MLQPTHDPIRECALALLRRAIMPLTACGSVLVEEIDILLAEAQRTSAEGEWHPGTVHPSYGPEGIERRILVAEGHAVPVGDSWLLSPHRWREQHISSPETSTPLPRVELTAALLRFAHSEVPSPLGEHEGLAPYMKVVAALNSLIDRQRELEKRIQRLEDDNMQLMLRTQGLECSGELR